MSSKAFLCCYFVDFQKLKYIDDLNTLLRFLSRRSFYTYKNYFTNNNDLRINGMRYSEVEAVE